MTEVQVDVIGHQARSKEGRGISVRSGDSDKWIIIQKTTFTNWVNLQLQPRNLEVRDLQEDFCDGVKLCALVEALQQKKIGRVVQKPLNQHQSLQNVTVALTAIANDNVRLVNIGSEDIVNGNQKLILGLIWHLILRYQIGKTKFPPKKLMLAWLRAVIPDCNISNFTSDWNDGVALHALLDYCKPGLCPDWKQLSRNNRLDNCTRAMTLAKNEFNIPMIVRPEDFSSPHLDDLSGMTYLSYYMTVDSPGYHATLRNVRALLKHGSINNFTTDWHDGVLLCNLTKSLGVEPKGWPSMTSNNVENLQRGMDSARKLGIEPILSAKEMSDPDVEHLGIMAYAAYFTRLTPRKVVAEKANISGDFNNVHVQQEKTFSVSVDSDVSPNDVRAEVIGPDSIPPVRMNWSGKTATCSFIPTETGMHKLNVYCEGEAVSGCPINFKVSSDRSQVSCRPIERCPMGFSTDMKVDTTRAGRGEVKIEARSPSGRVYNLPVNDKGGIQTGSFNPSEVGDWQMSVTYDNEHVGGSPYMVKVFDPNAVKVYGLEGGAVGKALAFNADTSMAGDGDLDVTVNYQGQNIPCYQTIESNGVHKINFTPQGAGAYKVNVRFAGEEVRGSPYTLEIVDSSMVSVTGDGLSLVPVNRPAVFNVQTRGAGGGNINVEVVSPSGHKLGTKINCESTDHYRIEYFPEEAGDHKITVFFYDQPLRGSPFTCKVYDLGKLVVRNMPKKVLPGNVVLFDIDASLAGSGNIEIRVNEGRVACSVENKGGHQFVASFIPEAPIIHYVEMTFNDAPVEGSPWMVTVLDPQQISAQGHGLELVPVRHKAKFKIYSDGAPLDDVKVVIKAPSNQILPASVSRSSDEIRVEYTPLEVGDHEIKVTMSGTEINGSPFLAKAYDTSAITVTPPVDGYVHKPIDFLIDVQEAGEGQLQIMVNNGNLPNEVEVQEDGIYKITFVPVEAGVQTIDISFNEEYLPCSPLICNASDLSSSVVFMRDTEIVNRRVEFDVQTHSSNGHDVDMTVEVYTPTGHKIPVHIQGSSSAGFRVEYTPHDIGTHVVTASLAGIPVKGSPFRVKTFDPTQVKVSKMPQGIVGTPCKFIVDASSAGEGTLELTVGANGRNIPNQARSLGGGRYEVSFVGRQATRHQANITYNGIPVPGCPFEIDFLDASRITAHGDGLSLVSCHRPSHFSVHAPGAAVPDLSVRVTAPDGRETSAKIRQKSDDTFDVDWTPHMIGDHRVVVEYADMPINGSPFTVKVFDASNVKVSHIGQGYLGRPVPFTLDASEAGDGNLEIQVTAENNSVPNYVRQDGEMSFKVSFTPQTAKTHHVNIRFNGEPVPGSPFGCRILDSDRVLVSQDSVKQIPSGVLASFKVDPQDAGEGDLQVKVISPTGHEIPARITGSSLSTYRVDYTPQEIGRYKVCVEYGGVEVNGSPFISNVYDPSLVKVEYPNRAYLGRPIYFHVDASAAGQGELAAEIKSHGTTVPSQFREVGVGRYELSFTPQDMSTHVVTALFNNYPIPGSPFHVDVIDTSSVTMSGQGLRSAQVYKETWFNLDLHGMDDSDLDVQIVSPSGHELPCKLSRKGHICRAEFTPMEVGSHFIDVFFAGNKLHGSPFISHAFDPSLVRITDVDRTGKREREIGFTVDASLAGVGELDAVVSHNGHRVQTYREAIDDGRYRYTFVPGESGHYEVNAKFNEEPIPGCPVVINVEDEIPTFITISFRSVEALNVNEKNHHFTLHMNGKQIDMNMLQIQIQAPNGEQVPARLAPQPNGDYKVEWTPNVAGRHMVDVMFAGQQIQGSPFYIEVFDITKVRVDNFYNGDINETAGFTVDGTRAGKAEQNIQITSPSGRNVSFDIQELRSGEQKITYKPVEGGKHKIQVAFGGLDVNGSPFIQEIGEGALPSVHGDGLYRGEEDKTAAFTIDSRGFTGEPTVQVDGPNSMAKVSLERQPDGNYSASYIPVEVGLFDVFVKWNGRDIHGSPFHPKIVDARKVRVVGGWQHYMDPQERVQLHVDEEKRIPFDTTDAGPGKLTAEVKGPSGHVHTIIDDNSIGRSVVCFIPKEEGNHYIHLYWSDHPLSNSPFLGYATGGSHDPSKVILTGRGLKEATIREEAEFLIDGSQAGPGSPDVQLTGVRAEVNVIVTPLGGGKFRCTYIPVVPGGYLLHISWNNRQLRGSPYKVNIIGAFYPNRVEVSGEGLKGGMMGDDIDVKIDTRKAGPGELTAYCMGPTHVAFCELHDNHDGRYNLRIKPQETGRHVLQIKYGGEHVLGSPYAFRISAQPDASKVRVSGPGVEHGILATFQSRFIVETRGAGQGQLTVRIRGPKGAFQVEMYRDSQKDRTILCRYDPAETGLYVISIRWSGVDVPGSPFHVNIVDTQHDLERILQESAFSSNTMMSRHSGNYSQWRDDI